MSSRRKDKFEVRFEGLERDPVFLRKRKATVACFIIRMFLLGAEYAIILPSIWLYLRTFDVEPWFLGIVVAVYPTAGVVSLPVVGFFFDKTKRTRLMILVLNAFEIVGNVIYSLPISQWFVFFGRMFAGFGDGFYAIASSEIVFTYPASQRTGIYALLELGRVLGITFGPALNFFLEKVDFSIGIWRIDYGTAPGLFMALLWILSQILTLYYVSDLSRLIDERAKHFPNFKLDPRGPPPSSYHIDGKRIRETSLCESVLDITVGEDKPLISNGRPHFKFYQSTTGSFIIDDDITEDDEFFENSFSATSDTESERYHNAEPPKKDLLSVIKQLCVREILVLFYSDLVLWLAQTEFEVLLPLVTQEDYGWKETYISIVYMVGGVWLMFVFFLIYKFSEKTNVKDQHYVIISLLLTISALILLMCEQIPDTNDLKTRIVIFMLICVLAFSAIPLNLVAIKSLITKLTPVETQGVTQGVYSSISRIALIVGPIIAGVAFNNRIVFGSVMALLNLFGLVGVVLSLRKIRVKLRQSEQANS